MIDMSTTVVTKNGTRANMEFITWLEKEMEARRWTKSDLMRASGLSHTIISQVLSGDKGAGPDSCNGIARAFGIPPETVFRKAGILPPLPGPEDDELARELIERIKRLTPEQRREVLSFVEWKVRAALTEDRPEFGSNEKDEKS